MSDLSGNSIDKFVDKYGHALKPKTERVKEAVKLLSKMKEVGILTNDAGYIEIKHRLDEWIQGGDKWSGIIEFSRLDQKAELELSVKPGKEIIMKLLAPKVKRRF
jgi:hypothetical protein